MEFCQGEISALFKSRRSKQPIKVPFSLPSLSAVDLKPNEIAAGSRCLQLQSAQAAESIIYLSLSLSLSLARFACSLSLFALA
jgi:hypothetical protein